MLQFYRQVLHVQNLSKLCARSMGKLDQFKWKPHKKKPNLRPKLSVILKQNVEKLGLKGQMVNVERGYARNFLVPKNIAAYATKENMKLYLNKYDSASNANPEAQISGQLMRVLETADLKIERKEGEPFEVNEHQVALECKRQYQLYVPVDCVKFRTPIRSFGEHTVDLAVRDNVLVPMKVSVLTWNPRVPNRFKKVLDSETNANNLVENTGTIIG